MIDKLSCFAVVFAIMAMGAACSPKGPANTSSPSNSVKTPKPADAPTINGTKLTTEMSDEQILKAFGVDIAKAQAKRSQGPDGYTIAYTFGEQSVYITRSMVTGLAIMASGPIKGDWTLRGGN